jgi:putative ABC transport system permease protein
MKKSVHPPRWAERLFQWYADRAAIEDLVGDLEELFHHEVQRRSRGYAQTRYVFRVISLMTSYALKKRRHRASFHAYSSTSFNFSMIRNYFLIATRNLLRHKMFTAINVFGLAVGMSISLLFIALLSFVNTYDTFHVNRDRIYRVLSSMEDNTFKGDFASAPEVTAQKLRDEVPGIQSVTRISNSLGGAVAYEKTEVPLSGLYVDENFLQVFTFPMTKGNPATAFRDPNTIVLTESAAEKLFGTVDPIGKLITMKDAGALVVTGVLKDVPKNSHMRFEMLSSYQTLERIRDRVPQTMAQWRDDANSYVYLQLPDEASRQRVESYLSALAPTLAVKEDNFSVRFELQAMNDIAPGRDLYRELGPDWGYTPIIIFGFLTLLILVPACSNYATIAISRSLKRMKEIGLRKAMGGMQRQIFAQFIMETVLVTVTALILSFFIFMMIRDEFTSTLVGGSSILDLEPTPLMVVYFVIFALLVGAFAGLVPAIYFARLNPVQALKTKPVSRRLSGLTLRKTLIAAQFTLSLGFIMTVVVVLSQYRYTMNFDFGFQQENILDVELSRAQPHLVKQEFSKLSSVNQVSLSSHVLGTQAVPSRWVKKVDTADSLEAYSMAVDPDFVENLELKLLAGHNFHHESVQRQIIVNEEFVKALRVAPSEAMGMSVQLDSTHEVQIIGVVRNFHFTTLSEPIRAFFLEYDPSQFRYANVRMSSADIINDISDMESTWKTLAGEEPFEAHFLRDEIEDAYSFYQSMVKICGFLGLMAITISCLGLLGMVVFTVENRLKEVGIRKVMGASASSVVVLLSRDFIKLMLIAIVIATPATYWLFENIYRGGGLYYVVSIGAGEIVISILIMLALGLTTIFSQTWRAAQTNPVDTLRHE